MNQYPIFFIWMNETFFQCRSEVPIQEEMKTCNCPALVMLKPCVRVNLWLSDSFEDILDTV